MTTRKEVNPWARSHVSMVFQDVPHGVRDIGHRSQPARGQVGADRAAYGSACPIPAASSMSVMCPDSATTRMRSTRVVAPSLFFRDVR